MTTRAPYDEAVTAIKALFADEKRQLILWMLGEYPDRKFIDLIHTAFESKIEDEKEAAKTSIDGDDIDSATSTLETIKSLQAIVDTLVSGGAEGG